MGASDFGRCVNFRSDFWAEHQDAAFWATHLGISDTLGEFQPPARFFEQLINGPGFYFPMPYEFVYGFAWLLGVALFWAWLGVGLDRRLHGVRTHFIRSRFRRAATYAASLLLALFFVWRFFEFLRLRGSLPSQTLHDIFLAWGLRLSALGVYVELPWAILYVSYFGYKLVSTLSEQTPA
jgi:hypothetical protein